MNMSHVTIRPIHNGFIVVVALQLAAAQAPKELSFATLADIVAYLEQNGFKPLES